MVRTLSRIGKYNQEVHSGRGEKLGKKVRLHQSPGVFTRYSLAPPAVRMLLGPRSGSHGLPLQHSTFRCLPVALGEKDRLLGPFYP